MDHKDTHERGRPTKQLILKTEMIAGMKLGTACIYCKTARMMSAPTA